MKIAAKLGALLFAIWISSLIFERIDLNGWGPVVWIGGSIALTLIRAPFEELIGKNRIVESRFDLVESLLLGGAILGTALIPAFHLAFGILAVADREESFWALLLGSALLVFGLWVFWRSHADLGKNWSVTLKIREEHRIVTTGIYRRIRHPMYAGLFLICLAQLFLLSNWVAGGSGVISFALLYLIRVPREEAMMRDQFGAAYDVYCQSRGRLVPVWHKGSEPKVAATLSSDQDGPNL